MSIGALLAFSGAVLFTSPALAEDFTVESAADLNEAILWANAHPDDYTSVTITKDFTADEDDPLETLTGGYLDIYGQDHTITFDSPMSANGFRVSGDASLSVVSLRVVLRATDGTPAFDLEGTDGDPDASPFFRMTYVDIVVEPDDRNAIRSAHVDFGVEHLTVTGGQHGIELTASFGEAYQQISRSEFIGQEERAISVDTTGEAGVELRSVKISEAGWAGIMLSAYDQSHIDVNQAWITESVNGYSLRTSDDGRIIVDQSSVDSSVNSAAIVVAGGGEIALRNVTLAENSGLYSTLTADVATDATLRLEHSTISANDPATPLPTIAIVGDADGAFIMNNSIVAGNENIGEFRDSDIALAGPATTMSYNFVGLADVSETALITALQDGDGNIYSTDPLSPLSPDLLPFDNYDPWNDIPSMLPAVDSEVVNSGDPDFSGSPERDGRDRWRLSGARLDIGAVEAQLPAAPEGFQASPSESSVALSWQEPDLFGDGAGIEEYRLEYSLHGADDYRLATVTASRGATVTGLTNGVIYDFRVAASNEYGWSTEYRVRRAIAGVPEPTIVMTPSTAEPGAEVTLTGTDFPYDSATVEFAIDDEDAIFAVSWPNDIGRFEDVRELPTELAGGTHELLAIVDGVVFASTTFTVPGGSSATLTADPAHAVPGSTIDVSGTGYAPGSMVELTLSPMTDPIGLAFPGADGAFFAQISIPLDATVGDHVLSASVDDDVLATTTLTVDARPAQPTTSLNSLTGTPGGELLLRGEGFEPGTVLDVFFHSTPFHLGSVTVGSSGTFEFAFTIPSHAEPGKHTVTVEVGGSVLASVALTVTAAPVPPLPLPSTGYDPSWLGLAGVLLLMAGLSVMVAAKRRA